MTWRLFSLPSSPMTTETPTTWPLHSRSCAGDSAILTSSSTSGFVTARRGTGAGTAV